MKTFKQFLKEAKKEELNEASDISYDDLVEEIRDKSQELKTEVDRIFNRFKYRMIVNVSYPLDKANKIEDEIYKELTDITKRVSKLYNKIG